jgi:hypothetical protein
MIKGENNKYKIVYFWNSRFERWEYFTSDVVWAMNYKRRYREEGFPCLAFVKRKE